MRREISCIFMYDFGAAHGLHSQIRTAGGLHLKSKIYNWYRIGLNQKIAQIGIEIRNL